MIDIVVALLAISIVKSTPLVLGALSGIVCERSGVVNIAIEGMMLTAAFAGFAVGVLHAAACALGAASPRCWRARCWRCCTRVLSVTLRVDQIISGTAINILAVGLTGFFNRQLFATGAPRGADGPAALQLPVLGDLPWSGRSCSSTSRSTLPAIVLVFVLHWALFRTRWGLRTRAVGEHPLAADTVGHQRRRGCATLTWCSAGRWPGSAAPTSRSNRCPHFEPLMTNGRGFIALAAMIFGKWTPFGAWGAALLFGLAEALPVALQIQGITVPFQLVGMLPYVLTIVVVAGAGRSRDAPGGRSGCRTSRARGER